MNNKKNIKDLKFFKNIENFQEKFFTQENLIETLNFIKTDQPGVDLKQENTEYEQGEKRYFPEEP